MICKYCFVSVLFVSKFVRKFPIVACRDLLPCSTYVALRGCCVKSLQGGAPGGSALWAEWACCPASPLSFHPPPFTPLPDCGDPLQPIPPPPLAKQHGTSHPQMLSALLVVSLGECKCGQQWDGASSFADG